MRIIHSQSTNVPIKLREKHENPLNPACALHLRRVCGVCVHFTGRTIRTSATCAMLGYLCAGGTDARSCEYWARKSAGGNQ